MLTANAYLRLQIGAPYLDQWGPTARLYLMTNSKCESGYCPCACPECFEIAISSDGEPAFCHECEAAGCDGEGSCSCEPDLGDEIEA